MANFFLDNKDLQYHLEHPLMRKIVELKERGFAEKDTYDYAPQNFEDAMDSYRKVLAIAGEVCGDVIAPNAESVDHEGPKVVKDVYKRQEHRSLRPNSSGCRSCDCCKPKRTAPCGTVLRAGSSVPSVARTPDRERRRLSAPGRTLPDRRTGASPFRRSFAASSRRRLSWRRR